MDEAIKNRSLRRIKTMIVAFTAVLLVGFTLLYAQLQGEVMELMILSEGRDVINKAEQIRTPGDVDALKALTDAMKYGFNFHSMARFRGAYRFRPYAVIKIYDQDDRLIAMESAGENPKRFARLEAKVDENKRRAWDFGASMVSRGTNIFSSKWLQAKYTATATEEDIHTSEYLYYTFAAEGYPLLVTLHKLWPIYFFVAFLLQFAILLVRRKFAITPMEDNPCPTPQNPI